MVGPSGMKAYTASVLDILSSAQLVISMPPKYYDQFEHMTCPQARYQARQSQYQNRQNIKVQTDNKYEYSVPTFNKFARLVVQGYQGNY